MQHSSSIIQHLQHTPYQSNSFTHLTHQPSTHISLFFSVMATNQHKKN
ncbi:hypothetical protein Pint_36673 [Pistacia integerrima]|uniref:Uncharacterized protein n=1 Tax=Pistacia integerrima TaxID=434235 RepID=A0ACC0Y2I6_9ROSI|nr:hypothetical protein Pint_36673 [Pistacia integerrima]